MPGQKFDEGTTVMGKWPGSSLYYEVQIASFDPLTQLYNVRYKDGTELDLKEGDMKPLGAFRKKGSSTASPSRRRSRSRSRSPARIRSPGRTPQTIQQPSPGPAARDSRKGDLLKVQLTPLKLEDLISGKSNGEAEGIGKTDVLSEHLPTTVEKDDYLREPLHSNVESEDHCIEPLRSNMESEDYFREALRSNVEREDHSWESLRSNVAREDPLRESLLSNVEREDPLRESLRRNAEREDHFRESLHSNVAREEKVVEELVKNERVLRFRRRKEEHVGKESTYTVLAKAKPASEIQSEFGGAIGTFFMTLCLPPLLYYLLNQCAQENASLFSFYPQWSLADLWNPTVLGYFALWMLLNALFCLLPIGKVAYGVHLPNGKQLKYRIHGIHSLLLVSVMAAVLLYYQVNLLYVYKHLHQFAAAATLFSVVLSVYAFRRSYQAPKADLSEAGKLDRFIYTFFMGRELNPHIGHFDLKYFIAIQPAINGWVLLNIIMILAEMDVQELDMPSVSMILVNSCQLLYVLHVLWNQEGMLTSLDIAYDGFGFMLAFGGLVWVPFTYSLQAIYLVNHPVDLSCTVIAGIITLNTVGYILFGYANNQKFAFRKNPYDPKLSYLKTIPTSDGSNLIVSGLWGCVRHPNYLGDLIMAWVWCLPCGFTCFLPYFYGFFLTSFLLHRVTRVEQRCKRKYGSDWQKYCRLVPYRLVPYIY